MGIDTIKIQNKGNTKIIAHRGLSGIERQNTNSAFVAAGNRSYFGIETDIHTTTGEEFAVIHDDTTRSVSDTNIIVEESSYDTLSQIILKNTDSIERIDLRIPTLRQYISICKKYGKFAVLEIKNRFTRTDIEKVISQIHELSYIDNVIFISFNLDNLIDLHELLPNAKIQYLFSKLSQQAIDAVKTYGFDVDVHYDVATKDFIQYMHSLGKQVNTWTVDKLEIAEKLIDNGIDYITSNILE
ncbi:MAG: hypothetical protein J6K12_05760 [Clostridia bacterium]|nr:hypothetical protein [Clostridia bacterium]